MKYLVILVILLVSCSENPVTVKKNEIQNIPNGTPRCYYKCHYQMYENISWFEI